MVQEQKLLELVPLRRDPNKGTPGFLFPHSPNRPKVCSSFPVLGPCSCAAHLAVPHVPVPFVMQKVDRAGTLALGSHHPELHLHQMDPSTKACTSTKTPHKPQWKTIKSSPGIDLELSVSWNAKPTFGASRETASIIRLVIYEKSNLKLAEFRAPS